MLSQAEMMALYEKMVRRKIKTSPSGIIELPVSSLYEYHNKVGFPADKISCFDLRLPGTQDGMYDYMIGPESDPDAAVQIMDVFYYDTDSAEAELLAPNKVLEESIYRRFYDGEIDFNGFLRVDQMGRLWIDAMSEDNIGVTFMIGLQPEGIGYEFCTEDNFHCQVWFDDTTFYYSPKNLMDAGKLPS